MASHDHPLVAVVVGPESCGKTTLAQQLSQALGAPVVPEVAREYLVGRLSKSAQQPVAYDADDLLQIAVQQVAAEEGVCAQTTSGLVVADTDLVVIEIWWLEKFGTPTAEFRALQRSRAGQRRCYLLCYPDLAWEPDPLRENPSDRVRLFQRYLELLEQTGSDYRVIWGVGEQRRRRALAYLREYETQLV